jgi:protein-tyrosine phosphatase
MLPGVDDGAATWNDALVMARAAVADGISVAIVTPHQLGINRQLDGPSIRAKTAHLQEYLNQNDIPLRVLPGAEIRIEPDLVEKIRHGEVLTLADRGRYVLLELPHEVYLPLDELLSNLRRAGLTGILAHVERNQGVLTEPALIASLLDAGCLLQVTAGSILGSFGPNVEKLARRLVERGEAHFVATDAHGPDMRRPQMRRSFQETVKLAGYREACNLFYNHPAAILHDEPLARSSKASSSKRSVLRRWFSWSKAG